MITFKFLAYSRLSSRRRIVSSAYCKIDTRPSIRSVPSPVSKPSPYSLLTKPLPPVRAEGPLSAAPPTPQRMRSNGPAALPGERHNLDYLCEVRGIT